MPNEHIAQVHRRPVGIVVLGRGASGTQLHRSNRVTSALQKTEEQPPQANQYPKTGRKASNNTASNAWSFVTVMILIALTGGFRVIKATFNDVFRLRRVALDTVRPAQL